MRNFHRSTLHALHALQELVQAAELMHPSGLNAHHIMRRIDDTEVRLLSRRIMQMQPGALLGPLNAEHNVFMEFKPQASAHSFRAVVQPS